MKSWRPKERNDTQLQCLALETACTLQAGANVLFFDRCGMRAPAVAAGVLVLVYALTPKAAIIHIEDACPGAKVAEEPPLVGGFAGSEGAIVVALWWQRLRPRPGDFPASPSGPVQSCGKRFL